MIARNHHRANARPPTGGDGGFDLGPGGIQHTHQAQPDEILLLSEAVRISRQGSEGLHG
jgi:hypothetical protein